ncbi:MAG: hypothetical protein R2793_00810 [Flavobacteriaceae bacterium]
MIELILVYTTGRYFYRLAEDFKKSKWGYAILGGLSYYIGIFTGGIILAVAEEIWGFSILQEGNKIVLTLILMPFGFLISFGLYSLLKKIWTKNQRGEEVSIDDIGKS